MIFLEGLKYHIGNFLGLFNLYTIDLFVFSLLCVVVSFFAWLITLWFLDWDDTHMSIFAILTLINGMVFFSNANLLVWSN